MTNNRNEEKLSEKVQMQNEERKEKRNPLDKYKDQQFVDDIPLDDLKIELEQEKNKHKTQDDSQSAKKYEPGFNKNRK